MQNKLNQYIAKINARLEATVGLSVNGLPDFDFSSAMEDGLTPSQVAKQMLADEGFNDWQMQNLVQNKPMNDKLDKQNEVSELAHVPAWEAEDDLTTYNQNEVSDYRDE